MNIRRAAVIMASTSSEKSSKWISSMPSSDTRGMFAAWKCQRERETSDSKPGSFFLYHSYKKPFIHQFWPANTSPAWFECRAIKVFIWEIQTCQANSGETVGRRTSYEQEIRSPSQLEPVYSILTVRADHFTATAVTHYIPMQITMLLCRKHLDSQQLGILIATIQNCKVNTLLCRISSSKCLYIHKHTSALCFTLFTTLS